VSAPRGLVATALLAACAVVFLRWCGEQESGPEAGGSEGPGAGVGATADPLRADDRVDGLIYDCPFPGDYDRNLADMVEVLSSKLVRALPDPMHHAKDQLASMEEEALPEIERLFDRSYTDGSRVAELQNSLDVAVRMESPGARDLVLRAIAHPRDAVRDLGLTGLVQHHARAEDYELLLQHVEAETSPRLRPAFASALHAADPARAAAEYLNWVEEGRHSDLWDQVLSAVVLIDDDALDARCARIFADAPLLPRHYLAAAAMRAGSEEAEAFLLEELAQEEPARRTRALQAFASIGRLELMPALFAAEPDPAIRLSIAEALATAEDDPAARDALRQGLDDPNEDVRLHCAGLLCMRADEVALERMLAALRGSFSELRDAMKALPPALREDPALATRAFESLRLRWEDEAELPLSQKLATLQAVGLTPGRAAAEWLYALGLSREEEEVLGLTPHRWFVMQVANTGDEGRGVLIEQLATTTDPVRRLDLIMGIASTRSERVRGVLLELVEDDGANPYERLYVADRLLRVGPATVVAPVLKRVGLRMELGEVRRALACLLWTWY
jgi:hypothetical protein